MRNRLAQIVCYLCLPAIAALLYWSPAIIQHTEFLR